MKTSRTPKKSAPVRRIASSLPPGIVHRAGVWECPHCEHKTKEHDAWSKTAVMLVTDTVHGKHGSVVVVSECPVCFKKSWIHQDFNHFSDYCDEYPKEWKVAANAEHDRRHLESVIRFADSLCGKCQFLKRLECDTLPIVRCTYGGRAEKFLHSSFTETECKEFIPRHPSTQNHHAPAV